MVLMLSIGTRIWRDISILGEATDPPAVPNPVIENSEILPKTPMVQTSMNPTDELPPDVEEPPAKEEEENDEYNSYVQPLMNGLSTLGNAASSVGTSAYNLFGDFKKRLTDAYYGPPVEEKRKRVRDTISTEEEEEERPLLPIICKSLMNLSLIIK